MNNKEPAKYIDFQKQRHNLINEQRINQELFIPKKYSLMGKSWDHQLLLVLSERTKITALRKLYLICVKMLAPKDFLILFEKHSEYA